MQNINQVLTCFLFDYNFAVFWGEDVPGIVPHHVAGWAVVSHYNDLPVPSLGLPHPYLLAALPHHLGEVTCRR